jgi:hypothetical protein
MWINHRPSPAFYPNGITLEPVGTSRQLARLRGLLDSALPRPWSAKDSCARLDLAALGFEVLFAATWVGLAADQPLADPTPKDLVWVPVTSEAELIEWEAVWRASDPEAGDSGGTPFFPVGLIADPDVRFLCGRVGARTLATAIANRSDGGTGPVVGVSNLAASRDAPATWRLGAVVAVRDAFPGLPVVGYESGDELAATLGLGFHALGPLRVWIVNSS